MKYSFKFRTDWRYVLHIILIVITLFIFYFIGRALLDFSSGPILIKMFFWFVPVLYLADHFWEWVLEV